MLGSGWYMSLDCPNEDKKEKEEKVSNNSICIVNVRLHPCPIAGLPLSIYHVPHPYPSIQRLAQSIVRTESLKNVTNYL